MIADDTARADFVAADLLAQAEHDGQAQAILRYAEPKLGGSDGGRDPNPTRQLSRRAILDKSLASSRCIVVPDLETAMRVANEYAAEHLILEVSEPRRWLPQIHNAGSIFLGRWSPEPMGDYCSGTNHVSADIWVRARLQRVVGARFCEGHDGAGVVAGGAAGAGADGGDAGGAGGSGCARECGDAAAGGACSGGRERRGRWR